MDCTNIGANIAAATCGHIAKSGTEDVNYYINFNDVDKAGSTIVNNVISEIGMKQTKSGYKFTTFEDAVDGEATLKKGTYVNSWLHSVTDRIFVKNELTKKFVNDLTGSKVIRIVANKEEGTAGEVKYEVYGWDSGLKVSEIKAVTTLTDGIVYEIKLATDEKSPEMSLPKSFFDTDLETTQQALSAIMTA